MKLTKIFEPITINKTEFKNRIVVSAMVTNYCNEDGTPTEKIMAYHEHKAKGGYSRWNTLSNSSLSNQSSETLVFSRKIGILILVPYVFSLVFALMSRNKGNFLFRLPRPPYQAVLRKFVSLLS